MIDEHGGLRGTDALLERARARYERVEPARAAEELLRGEAVLVDTRSEALRREHGDIDPRFGPITLERNVLEWRFDPTGSHRLPQASADARVIVLCQEGYSSSLAAASLLDLGVSRATDLVGGYEAWRAAGLPTVDHPGS